MPHHYIDQKQWQDGSIIAEGREAHHLANVLRAKVGDSVPVFDGAGRVASTEVQEVSHSRLLLKIMHEDQPDPPPVQIVLLQSIPKGKKMELVVEKATELGVSVIVPLLTERTVVKIAEKEKAAKVERWTRVAISAAEQCGTPRLPCIKMPCTLKQALASLDVDGFIAATLETETIPIETAVASIREKQPASVACLIGPEGDLTATEVRAAEGAGAIAVSLGTLVLRSETAGLYCAGILKYEFFR